MLTPCMISVTGLAGVAGGATNWSVCQTSCANIFSRCTRCNGKGSQHTEMLKKCTWRGDTQPRARSQRTTPVDIVAGDHPIWVSLYSAHYAFEIIDVADN